MLHQAVIPECEGTRGPLETTAEFCADLMFENKVQHFYLLFQTVPKILQSPVYRSLLSWLQDGSHGRMVCGNRSARSPLPDSSILSLRVPHDAGFGNVDGCQSAQQILHALRERFVSKPGLRTG